MANSKYQIACLHCGTKFQAVTARARFCQECRVQGNKIRETLNLPKQNSNLEMNTIQAEAKLDWDQQQELLPKWQRKPWPGL